MNMNIASLAKGLVLGCDILNLLDGMNKVQECQTNRWVHAAYLVNRIVVLGCTLTHVGLELSGANAKTLQFEKAIELFPRAASFILRLAKEAALLDESQTPPNLQALSRFLQRGFLAPLSDIAITSIEFDAYNFKGYVDMTPAEFEKAKQYLYEYDINQDNYKSMLEEAPRMLMGASLARFAFETRAIDIASNAAMNTYFSLIHYMRHFRILANELDVLANQAAPAPNRMADANHPVAVPHQQTPMRRAAVSTGTQTDELTEEEVGLFVNFPFIIPPLHNDNLFKKYICPITHEPIRDPVGDPHTSTTLYERAAIHTWLSNHQVSPWTNKPLEPSQLIEKPALKNAINHRLRYHQEKVWEYMRSQDYQNILNTPLEANIELTIREENPNVHTV